MKIFLLGLTVKALQFLVWYLQIEFYKLTGVSL